MEEEDFCGIASAAIICKRGEERRVSNFFLELTHDLHVHIIMLYGHTALHGTCKSTSTRQESAAAVTMPPDERVAA